MPAALLAQAAPAVPAPAAAPRQAPAPAAAAGSYKVAVIDFQAALAGNIEGKKAQERLGTEVNKRQSDMEKTQKSLEDAQNKLRTQDKALSDTAKADLSRDIDRWTTELQRKNDDAQKELQDLQQQLLRPIAERLQKVLQAYASEMGYAVVLDAMSVVYFQDIADITTEIIRRVDADVAATARPAAPAAK
jgi:Skp family chaperone for outer membrane proteins